MSLEDSDDLNISDAAPVDPVLEAGAFPKFDMHLYRSSLNESHVRYLVKLYGIPEELHPRVIPEGMTMNVLPPGAIGLYAHCGADPFPKPSEYNASDVTKLREVVISLHRPPLSILYIAGPSNVWKHAGRAFSIKDSEGKGNILVSSGVCCCRDPASTRCRQGDPPGPPPTARLEGIPPKTSDMIVAEMPCRKVIDDKEREKRKAEEKAATKAPADDIQVEEAVAKAAGREGPRKKRRVRVGAQTPLDSEHVSSPTPLNQAKPLEALANEEHVSHPLSVGRMGTLRDQTDEHAISPCVVYTSKLIVEEGEKGDADASPALEGHGDNEDGLSGPQILPRSVCPSEPAPEKFVPNAEASYSVGLFGNHPFTPQ
ncbi:hypothetical protein Tco_1575267 [Tanacetum coccineum]